jgi:uncharacterized protein DUF6159
VERIRRGFRLLGASWDVLKSDRELLVLPLLSFLGIVVVTLSIAGIGWGAGTFENTPAGDGVRTGPLEYVLLGAFYFLTYFVSIFFNAAVVGAATIRLQGGDPTVRDGLRVARQHIGKIAGWAAISATVGLILRSIEERAGFLGKIAVAIIGAAWGAITFFVVPVLLYEPVSVTGSIKRSVQIFKARWGEQFTGNLALGLALFLIGLPVLIVFGALSFAAPIIGIPLLVVSIAVLAAVGSAMSGIFNAALYRYAVAGEAGGAFSAEDLGATFKPKRAK